MLGSVNSSKNNAVPLELTFEFDHWRVRAECLREF